MDGGVQTMSVLEKMSPKEREKFDSKVLHRAVSYPYPRPSGDFLFNCGSGEAEEVADGREWLKGETEPRICVLACGSNASPQQLARKFPAHSFADQVFPVLACTLTGFDTVYSAGLTGYGSIPATLYPSSCTLSIHATFLTEAQVARMHETEGGYHYVKLKNISLKFGNGDVLHEALTYTHKAGALAVKGAPLALEEIPSVDRRFEECVQKGALAIVAEELDFSDVAELVHTITTDEKEKSRMQKLLTGLPLPKDCYEMQFTCGEGNVK